MGRGRAVSRLFAEPLPARMEWNEGEPGALRVGHRRLVVVALGQDALALTDTNGLYGAVRFWNAARERKVKPIFGVELRLVDADPVTLLAMDRTGWTSLCRIVSLAQLAGEKTKPRATFALVADQAAGLIALSESDDV